MATNERLVNKNCLAGKIADRKHSETDHLHSLSVTIMHYEVDSSVVEEADSPVTEAGAYMVEVAWGLEQMGS